MSVNFPAQQEIINRIKSDIQSELEDANPFLRNSFLQAQCVGYAGRVNELYLKLKILLKQMFPQSASGEYLAQWGNLINVNQNTATISRGTATATGTVGSTIAAGTLVQVNGGGEYTVQQQVTIALNQNTITALTCSSGTVTAITAGNHNYATGIDVTVSGASQTDYNGTFPIVVTGLNSFTYAINTSPVTPATGAPVAAANTASVQINSNAFGAAQNLDSGAVLTLGTPLPGISSTLFVQYGGLTGGTDDETSDDYEIRVVDGWQNPNTPFNVAEITKIAKEVTGVTRVFVQTPSTLLQTVTVSSLTQVNGIATVVCALAHNLVSGMLVTISGASLGEYNLQNVPILVIDSVTFIYLVSNSLTSPAVGTLTAQYAPVQPGQTRVYFTRDNDINIIPSGADVANVRAKLLTILPADMDESQLLTPIQSALTINFTFTALDPNTDTMQAAIAANLQEFFRNSVSMGQTLLAKAYNSVIFNTIDSDTGELINNFTLSVPSGDITVQADQLPVLGILTFP